MSVMSWEKSYKKQTLYLQAVTKLFQTFSTAKQIIVTL